MKSLVKATKALPFLFFALSAMDSHGQAKVAKRQDSMPRERQVVQTQVPADSIARALREIDAKFDKLAKKDESQWFVGILSAMVGGLLVLAGQAIDRWYKSKADKQAIVQGVKTQVIYLVNLLPRLLSSLAYYKVDAQLQNYWVDNCPENNVSDKDKYFDEMHRDFATINEFEIRINDTIAQIASQLAKFDLVNKSVLFTTEARELGTINFDEKPTPIEREMGGESAAIESNIAALLAKFQVKYKPIKDCVDKFPD